METLKYFLEVALRVDLIGKLDFSFIFAILSVDRGSDLVLLKA